MVANILQILILGLVQGAAELLPVSSSAHVIVVEKLMGLDASSPEMTFLLVMLHTGTMFAVIVYFWNAWRLSYFSSAEVFWKTAKQVIVREFWRLIKAHPEVTKADHLVPLALPGIIGMVASFVAGLLALRLLSRWLETGRWKLFGVYCILFAVFVFALAAFGF